MAKNCILLVSRTKGMTGEIDLEAELGTLALPDDDLIGRLLKAARWLSSLSPDTAALTQGLAANEILRQPRKKARIAYCLIGLYDRVQRVSARLDHDYIRRDEFADLLEDVLGLVGKEPNEDRRKNLTVIAANAALKKDPRPPFEQERMVIRLADELSLGHIRVVLAHVGARTRDEQLIGRTAILERRAQVGSVDRLIEDLCSFRVMDRNALTSSPPLDGLTDGLLPIGRRLIEYLQEP